jgi:hypothetical protein
MYISWGDAIRMEQSGWVPADGDNGTPPWVVEDGGSQRYVKSVKKGFDPWTGSNQNPNTGGGASIDIDDHTLNSACFCFCAGGTPVTVLTGPTTLTHAGDFAVDPPHIEAIPMMRVR